MAPPETDALVGRWVLEDSTAEVFMNSAGAAGGDFLVPEPSGGWHILTGDGQRQTGTVSRAQAPDELEAESVRTIGDKLEQLTRDSASWLEWLDAHGWTQRVGDQRHRGPKLG